jgi:hypothetical protein
MSEPKKSSIELWPVENLTPYKLNAKKHDSVQVAKIVQAIQRFGWSDAHAIEVDADGMILSGHGRRLAAMELGMKRVKVQVVTHLSADDARAYRLSVNRVAISDIDPELLREELSTLDASLEGIFDAKELDFMVADMGEMNIDAFVSDMGEVLEDQRLDIEERSARATSDDTRIPLAKAFGFRDIGASGTFAITNLMAKAEAATGLKNDAALIAFASSLE